MREVGDVGAVSACATREALDALLVPGRATACRLADDELLLVCDPAEADEVAREVETRLSVLDPDALVLDASDGWGGLLLDSEDAGHAFARLSRLPLPEHGFVQGEVCHVPAKVLVADGGIRILVAAALGDHLRSRVEAIVDPEGPA